MLLDPLDMPKEILSCSGSGMTGKGAVGADGLELTIPWLPPESGAQGSAMHVDLSSRDGCPRGYSLHTSCTVAWCCTPKNRKAQDSEDS